MDLPGATAGTQDIEALVRRAQGGDAEAFGVLYRVSITRIGRYVGAIVRDPARTEEAVAEAYLHAWRDLGKLRQPERFIAWLYRIAHRRALAEVQRPRLEQLEAAGHLIDERRDASPEESVLASTTAAAVRDVLLGLPDVHREVLVLRHMGELSHREIAQQLGKSEDAVRMAYSRASKALRAEIERTKGQPT